jgi:hypothetical protein
MSKARRARNLLPTDEFASPGTVSLYRQPPDKIVWSSGVTPAAVIRTSTFRFETSGFRSSPVLGYPVTWPLRFFTVHFALAGQTPSGLCGC